MDNVKNLTLAGFLLAQALALTAMRCWAAELSKQETELAGRLKSAGMDPWGVPGLEDASQDIFIW